MVACEINLENVCMKIKWIFKRIKQNQLLKLIHDEFQAFTSAHLKFTFGSTAFKGSFAFDVHKYKVFQATKILFCLLLLSILDIISQCSHCSAHNYTRTCVLGIN